MTDDIRKRVERVPFEPFSIRTSDGREYPVPTIDHIWLPPDSNRVYVADDKGMVDTIRLIHISSLREKRNGNP